MADIEYFDDPSEPPKGPKGKLGATQLLGAACSVVLALGLAVWAVQLIVRDVTEVPVIRNLAEPMRVRPENPGGTQMAHQGLAVNEIRAGGIATPAPDRIVLAPPPVTLEAPAAAIATSASQVAPTAPVVAEVPVIDEPVFQVPEYTQQIESLGLATSARPSPRPANRPVVQVASNTPQISTRLPTIDAGSTAQNAPAQISRSSIDVTPDSIPAGTRLVQLGAFDDAETARREWDRLYGRFGDYMQDKQRLIMRVRSNGRDFYRLRVVGFASADDSRRFCSAFLARNTACIPVVSR